MQFRVPQNIDLEDKIVGPLTMIQFVYLLAGGLIDYMLFQWFAPYSMALYLLFALPIAVLALGLAFLKIQDQPLSHFITAGIYYLTHPKIRLWRQEGNLAPMIKNAPQKQATATPISKEAIERSELDKLAQALDTSRPQVEEEKHFGKITKGFEQLLKENPNQGGARGSVEQTQKSNR